jgi:hypothetical protein
MEVVALHLLKNHQVHLNQMVVEEEHLLLVERLLLVVRLLLVEHQLQLKIFFF